LRARGALLAEERIFVLRVAIDFVAFGYDFGGIAHDHVDAGQFFKERGMRIIVPREHGNALDAAADGGVDAFVDDLVSSDSDGLQT
jgi:hypothetical protein